MAVPETSLIYIHGFNSSPASHKAGLLRSVFEQAGCPERLIVPTLPPSPRLAMAELDAVPQRTETESADS